MKIHPDINVFMDALERRRGWVHSLEVISRVRRQEIKSCTSALTIPIIYFLRLRYTSEQRARQDTLRITRAFEIVPLSGRIIHKAAESELPDFEDNVQIFSALEDGADYLITRNKVHFRQEQIAVASPEEWLTIVAG